MQSSHSVMESQHICKSMLTGSAVHAYCTDLNCTLPPRSHARGVAHSVEGLVCKCAPGETETMLLVHISSTNTWVMYPNGNVKKGEISMDPFDCTNQPGVWFACRKLKGGLVIRAIWIDEHGIERLAAVGKYCPRIGKWFVYKTDIPLYGVCPEGCGTEFHTDEESRGPCANCHLIELQEPSEHADKKQRR